MFEEAMAEAKKALQSGDAEQIRAALTELEGCSVKGIDEIKKNDKLIISALLRSKVIGSSKSTLIVGSLLLLASSVLFLLGQQKQ